MLPYQFTHIRMSWWWLVILAKWQAYNTILENKVSDWCNFSDIDIWVDLHSHIVQFLNFIILSFGLWMIASNDSVIFIWLIWKMIVLKCLVFTHSSISNCCRHLIELKTPNFLSLLVMPVENLLLQSAGTSLIFLQWIRVRTEEQWTRQPSYIVRKCNQNLHHSTIFIRATNLAHLFIPIKGRLQWIGFSIYILSSQNTSEILFNLAQIKK